MLSSIYKSKEQEYLLWYRILLKDYLERTDIILTQIVQLLLEHID
jgi:hypothetical protein